MRRKKIINIPIWSENLKAGNRKEKKDYKGRKVKMFKTKKRYKIRGQQRKRKKRKKIGQEGLWYKE